MHRKLQKVGGSTYTISLPKNWIEEHGLGSGSELVVKEEENGLVILPQETTKREKHVDAASPILLREILTAYLSGYDKIVVKSKGRISPLKKKEAKKTIERVVGMEIVEETSNQLVIQDLLDHRELDVKKAIKQAYRISASMHNDAVESLLENDKGLAEEVMGRDNEVDRLYFLVIRQLKSALVDSSYGLSSSECMDLRLLIKSIETLADHSCNIARRVLELNKKVDVKRLSDEVFNYHEKAFSAFWSRDVKTAEKLRQKRLDLFRKKEKLYGKVPAQILDGVDGIAECGVSIADLVV